MYLFCLVSLNIEFLFKINRRIDQNYSIRFKIYAFFSLFLSSISIIIFASLGQIGKRADHTCGIIYSDNNIYYLLISCLLVISLNLYCIYVYYRKLSKKQRKVWRLVLRLLSFLMFSKIFQIVVFKIAWSNIDNFVTIVFDAATGTIVSVYWVFESNIIKFLRTQRQIKRINIRVNIAETGLSELASNILSKEFGESMDLSEAQFFSDFFDNMTKKVKNYAGTT